MSSKILIDGSTAVEPLVWRKLPGEGPTAEDEAPSPSVPDENTVLQARLRELEKDLHHRSEQAFAAGYRKGEAEGQAKAAAELEPVMQRFARSVQELIETRRQMKRDAESDLLKLSLAIARRVLHRELSIDPEAMLGVVQAALARLEGRAIDRIRVNPLDAAPIRDYLARLGRTSGVEVVADNQLERGAAVFETERGSLDASIEAQLDEIRRGLADRLGAPV